jgi:phosphoenolpyruvate carboxylase
LRDRGLSTDEIVSLLRQIDIELVFTAHPTEAKRRSVRSKLRSIRELLEALDSDQIVPSEEDLLLRRLRGELVKLWQTDFVRMHRPSVELEVRRGMSFQPVLWTTLPRIYDALRGALGVTLPEESAEIPRLLRFGSWIGGDRDGNPFVTSEITLQTFQWLRDTALASHLATCQNLADSLSISRRQSRTCHVLEGCVDAACVRWPELQREVATTPMHETYRRWLRVVGWRLERTAAVRIADSHAVGCYESAEELAADVLPMREALLADKSVEIAYGDMQTWIDQIHVFGFHTARLDVRQHADVYRHVIKEIFRQAGLLKSAKAPTESEWRHLLVSTLEQARQVEPTNLSPMATETLALFVALRRVARVFGIAALGGLVISMTAQPIDVLAVLWLWKWSERVDGGDPRDADLRPPIVPLFETIVDLRRAPDVLAALLDVPAYRAWIRAQRDRQIVMLGYSDSTKAGGYLAACWGLHRAQTTLHRVAADHGIHITFFHGRGGSLGRGGGPTARAILSLPATTFDGALRLTEQGEILAERYDDPHIAYRHWEQVLWSVIMALTQAAGEIEESWPRTMDRLAYSSLQAYRVLVDDPAFGHFFRTVTPISDIENLKIASRPARRTASDRLEDLRAIPWVFAWTQCRCLIPAWYGVGTALEALLKAEPDAQQELRRMYDEWPFFQATIDNAVLAVAKSNRAVFRRYVELAGGDPVFRGLLSLIESEWDRAEDALRKVTGCVELLDDIPWLKESIAVRDRYVEPLNLIQAELQYRGRQAEVEPEELIHLKQLALKGVAAGMRTTG